MDVEALPGHTFGAVVRGVCLATVLQSSDPDKLTTLRQHCLDLFHQYGVLIFPKQRLTPQEELDFAKWFPHHSDAPIEERAGPYSDTFRRWKLPALPEVQVQGWGKLQDHHGVSGVMTPSVMCHEWHTDGIHELEKPCVYTSMYAVKVPPTGGDTLFCSGYEVWESLTAEEREDLGRRTVTYSSQRNRMSYDGCLATQGEPNVSNGPDVEVTSSAVAEYRHPLFRQHPVTGGVALFTAPLFMKEVAGCEGEHGKGAALIARLLRKGVQGAYRHKFSEGDLVIWDNRCILHSATPMPSLPPPGLRVVHRIRMSSTEIPVAPV